MHHIFIAPFEICSYSQFNYCFVYLEIGFGRRAGKQHCLALAAKQDLSGYSFFFPFVNMFIFNCFNNLYPININLLLRLSVIFHLNWRNNFWFAP